MCPHFSRHVETVRRSYICSPALAMNLRALSFLLLPTLAVGASLGIAAFVPRAPEVAFAPGQAQFQASQGARPAYNLELHVDFELRTLRGRAEVLVPARPSDPLRDVTLLLLANASASEGRKHLVVDAVKLDGQNVPFRLESSVLKVTLPNPQERPFTLDIAYHGVVPQGAAQNEMGGMLGADVSGLLGGMAAGEGQAPAAAKKTTDYGLYSDADGIMSLGAFWYPQLAVRQNGKWADAQPESLGDLAYADMADFRLELVVPERVLVVAPGVVRRVAEGSRVLVEANNRRDFALVMSDRFVSSAKTVVVGGKNVRIESYARRENARKLAQSIDIAEKSLQIFSARFGPYLYDEFKIVESPLRGGAGGMEYSGMTGLSSMLYADMSRQLGGMVTTLNLPGAEALLGDLAGNGAPAEATNDGTGMTGALGGVLGEQLAILDSLLETTLAHEVAHQWFAIGVGSDSQNHPFVDESLVNWATMLYFEDRYGREKAQQMSELHLKTSFSMGAMLGGGDKPANLPASAYANNLQYGAVIYGKGAIFYQNLRALVGDEIFFDALRSYYREFRNQLAGPADLRSLIETRAPDKAARIDALYRRWIEEAHGQEDIGGGGLGDLLGGLGGLDLGGLLGGIGME